MRRSECLRSGPGRGLLFLLLTALVALGLAACTNPEKAKAEHLRRGQQYLTEKKYPEAALEFRNALQLDDRLGEAHWGLAQAYEGQENFLPAVQELLRVLELDQNYSKPYTSDAAVRLGNYYIIAYQGNPTANKQLKDQAGKLADDVLGHDANHIEAHILKAGVLYADGKRDEALTQLKTAVELNPQRIESLMGLARFYVQAGDVGTYLVHATLAKGGSTVAASDAAVSLPYSPEYLVFGRDEGFLRQLAHEGSGTVLSSAALAWKQPSLPVPINSEVFWFLLIAVACLWPLDIAMRRLTLTPRQLGGLVRAMVTLRKPEEIELAAPEELQRLRRRVAGMRRRRPADIPTVMTGTAGPASDPSPAHVDSGWTWSLSSVSIQRAVPVS